MKNLLFVLVALLTVSANASTVKHENILVKEVIQSGNYMPPVPPNMKPLTSFLIEVESSGCTESADFKTHVFQTTGRQEVLIERIKPDTCKGITRRIEVQISTRDLNLSKEAWNGQGQKFIRNPILVINPLYVVDQTAH